MTSALLQHFRRRAKKHSDAFWSRGGLTPVELIRRLWTRAIAHSLWDQAAALSFYFLVALFPVLLVLSTLIGFLMASQSGEYFSLLEYLDGIMPTSAVQIFSGLLSQLTSGATSGKVSFGALVALWGASSGITASITTLNIAFEVPTTRSWWRRRLLALALTLGIGLVIAASLLVFLTGSTAVAAIGRHLPVLDVLSGLSSVVRWLAGLSLLWLCLSLLYGFGPNLNRRRWEGILPGSCFALGGWLVASFCLRFYLSVFGSLNRTYGSLAGVIALLFWIYLSASALLLGGELNAIIWHASADRYENKS
jgi:membrane protein